MTRLGIIGSGHIGGTVARLAIEAGHEVVLSNSRGPTSLCELVGELGPRARAATRDEAAASGELVLVSIPVKAYPSLLEVTSLEEKVVMDTGNYYRERDGDISELGDQSLTDSEYLARFLDRSQVVKVFNNIYFEHLLRLGRPLGASDRSSLPIAGDDPAAKARVRDFLDSIGYDAVDAGSLSQSWRQQPSTPVYGRPYGSFDDKTGTPAPSDAINHALWQASR